MDPQVLVKIWHNSHPHKVGTLIWLTLNRKLHVGTWLQCMGIPPPCKVCPNETLKSLQHCFLECAKAKHAWEAYLKVWQKWGASDNVALSWPFILLGELVFEREDDLPNIQGYHTGSFSYIRQLLDIFKRFILYFLWSKSCRMHFDDHYSSRNVV